MPARMIGVLFGCGTVLVVALIARRLAGGRAALFAAGLCALYPSFIAADGSIMSEPLFGLFVALVVLQALRLSDFGRVRDAALLGGVIGLAALARSESLLLVVLLGVPSLIAMRRRRG